MEPAKNTTKSRPAGYLLFAIFMLTCPCHLIVVAPLLAGTLLATYISEHFLLIFAVLLLLSLLSALASMRLLDKPRAQ